MTDAMEVLEKVAGHAAACGHHELVHRITGVTAELANTDARRHSVTHMNRAALKKTKQKPQQMTTNVHELLDWMFQEWCDDGGINYDMGKWLFCRNGAEETFDWHPSVCVGCDGEFGRTYGTNY